MWASRRAQKLGMVAVAPLIVLTSACGTSPEASRVVAQPHESNPISTSTTDAPKASASIESTSSTSPAPTTTRADTNTLTGFGASVSTWNAHHKLDSRYASTKCCYDRNDGLNAYKDEPDDDYTDVRSGATITGYTINFPLHTPLAVAKAKVLASLPLDSRVLWYQTSTNTTQFDTTACGEEELSSATLATLEPPGQVGVGFYTYRDDGTSPTFDPTEVTTAIVDGVPATTPAQAAPC